MDNLFMQKPIYLIQLEGEDDFLCDDVGVVLFFDDMVQLSSYVKSEGLDEDKVIVITTIQGYESND